MEADFAGTEAAADKLLQHALATPHATSSPEVIRQTERLLQASFQQSREFIRHLEFMLKHSAAVKSVPLAPVVLLHIIRESAYFLEVLERLNRPGQIAGSMAGTPPYPDPYHAGAGAQPPYREQEHAIPAKEGDAEELSAIEAEQPRLTAPTATTVSAALNREEPSEANGTTEPEPESSLEEAHLRQEPAADDNAQLRQPACRNAPFRSADIRFLPCLTRIMHWSPTSMSRRCAFTTTSTIKRTSTI
ncbi:hypothetical protein HMSSN139_46600 [Paenibacillus sp. HMSSN-139]|nr:hypothetical protein HMSSN139_46600 [Paenibacillus sp. HMSSN-139]